MWVRRGTMSMRQQKCSAPRGAVRIQRFSGGPRPAAREAAQPVVQECGAGRAVVVEARARPARREHELEGQPRAVGGHEHRLVVDRDDALAELDLLLHEVLQEVPAHRPLGVRAEALALAGDGGGDEVQRVDLRVGVGQRGAGLAALVDDDVDVGGASRRARACARATRRPPAHLLDVEVGQRGDRVGGVDDDLVAPRAGATAKRSGFAKGRAARCPGRAPDRGWARRARASRACPARRRWRAARRSRAACGPRGPRGRDPSRCRSVGRGGGEASARPRGAIGGDDGPVAGERVDANLGHGPGRVDQEIVRPSAGGRVGGSDRGGCRRSARLARLSAPAYCSRASPAARAPRAARRGRGTSPARRRGGGRSRSRR